MLDIIEELRLSLNDLLTCHGNVTIGFALLDHLEHILGRGNKTLRGPLDEGHSIFVFMHAQIYLRNIEQISNLVHVDLIVRDLDVKLQILFHGVDVIENVVNNAWNDTLFHRITDDALHCVRLAGGCLTIGKYRSIVASEDIRDNRFGRLIVHLLLRCVRLEDFVKQIDFTL